MKQQGLSVGGLRESQRGCRVYDPRLPSAFGKHNLWDVFGDLAPRDMLKRSSASATCTSS